MSLNLSSGNFHGCGSHILVAASSLSKRYFIPKRLKIFLRFSLSSFGKRAIGVVSANPAFMMNKDLEGGTYIALKGRVPVKVIGSVCKGDNLIAADNGFSTKSVHHSSEIFAIALEDSGDIGEKLIEAIVI